MSRRPSIDELARQLRSGELSPVELTADSLARIDRQDPALGAFRFVCADRAMDLARRAERDLRGGRDLGPLHGIPYVAKDLLDVEGLPTTAGTRLLGDNVAGRHATVIRRLEDAGMIVLGKTVTVQFAYGGAGINHDQGTPHNPWHATPHLPGGSSSGTAVALAAGLAPVGLGTDTGGSVRIPASFCGLTGLKTTVGRVSRAGVYPLSYSLDSVGSLAHTVDDVARLTQAMQGSDPLDPITLHSPIADVWPPVAAEGVQGMRIAFAETVFNDGVDAEVQQAVQEAGDAFAELGVHVGRVEFPQARAAVELNPKGLVIAAEAYTVNRRFLEQHYDDLDPIVAVRMLQGKDVAAHDYIRMRRDWQRLQAEVAEGFGKAHALLCPTVMIPPVPVADADRDMETYLETNMKCLRNTSIGNLLGLCGLSVPCGFTRAGLPIGLQIYGRPFDESTVLRLGRAFQQVTDWHRRAPDLSWIEGRTG